ncbi:MAG: hypothetical protein KatS3mg009_1851 [Acidimicrobiia bacterium]|nr:MAG: hypothetical protein KatS3mg009_1851 [Acidimicrobiia bacterium]
MTTNEQMIGREDVNDLEAILSITNTDVDAVAHTVGANLDAVFTWDYERSRPALVKLYEKAKTSQWNASTDLDWSIEVDQEQVVLANAAQDNRFFTDAVDLSGTALREVDREGMGAARHRVAELDAARSSCTASRVRCCAPPGSSRPCRGSTPSTTRRPR